MGRYLIAISYALCMLVIGQMLKGCESHANEITEREITLKCFEKGTPVYKLGKYSHCVIDSGKGWGEA